jgi:hypothetical protein
MVMIKSKGTCDFLLRACGAFFADLKGINEPEEKRFGVFWVPDRDLFEILAPLAMHFLIPSMI